MRHDLSLVREQNPGTKRPWMMRIVRGRYWEVIDRLDVLSMNRDYFESSGLEHRDPIGVETITEGPHLNMNDY